MGQHSAKMQSQGADLLQSSPLSRPKLVERFFNKIKQCRRVATRYDKVAANYLAFIQLASIRLWLRVNEFRAQVTSQWQGRGLRAERQPKDRSLQSRAATAIGRSSRAARYVHC